MPKLNTSTVTPKKRSSTTRRKKAEPQQKARKVVYPELAPRVGWLSGEQARQFLGWKQSEEEEPFKEYLLKDVNGTPTKCFNVDKQRPFYPALANQWKGEILGGHWNGDGGESNGESIAVGKTGLVIEGKHRMVGLALAVQEWLKDPDRYPYWQEEPKIHTFINVGVREDMVSINTINTGKPRSLGDAIYASGLFGQMSGSKSKDRRKIRVLSKMLDYAVRLLWHRTGASKNAFAPRRSHAESLDFIQRHPKLMDCVKHIYEEDGGKEARLKYYPSPGYAAALLYMMGSAASVRETDEEDGYMQADCPSEELLDWSLYEKACSFWTRLAARDKSMDALRQAVADLLDSEDGSFRNERLALVIKAWWQFVLDQPITARAIELETTEDGDGVKRLNECPTVGEMLGDLNSIDLGDEANES